MRVPYSSGNGVAATNPFRVDDDGLIPYLFPNRNRHFATLNDMCDLEQRARVMSVHRRKAGRED
jgi:hypothetical protein